MIGHSISVMGVQAGAVRRVLPAERRRERDALLAVEQAGRDAVDEMRRLIGLLRTDEEGIGAPNPSLSRIEALAAEVRDAGQPLELRVEGDLAGLPPGVDLAGYRIVQEALTNSLKHAPGARVEAVVRSTGEAIELEVDRRRARSRRRPTATWATAWWACASGWPSTAASWPWAPATGGASACTRGCPCGAADGIRVLLADDQALVRGGFP